MKIKELIFEAPLAGSQEERLRRDIERSKDYRIGAIRDLIKKISPEARVLDGGTFGTVFHRVGNKPNKEADSKVIKIAFNDRFTLRYLRWCLKNQNNPHVPKIYMLFSNTRKDQEFLYVSMEKLAPIDATFKWGIEHIPFLTYLYYAERTVPSSLIVKIMGGQTPIDYIMNDRSVRESWDTDPAVQVLKAAGKISNDRFDITVGERSTSNVMHRPGTNTIVITDPVYTTNRKRQ